jgi:hypothetical protein
MNRLGTLEEHAPQIVGLIVFTVALWAQTDDAYVGLFLADGVNLVVAKSVSLGEGLRFIHLPDQPPATWVHPAYPFMLSFVGRIWPSFPDNLVLVQILDSALLGVSAWLICRHSRNLNVRPIVVCTVVAMGFVSTQLLSLSVSAFAQPMFLALTAGAVLLVDSDKSSWLLALGTGVIVGVAILTLELGPFVLGGVCTALIVRRRWLPTALIAAVALALWLPWMFWSRAIFEPATLASSVVRAAILVGNADGGVSWFGFGPLLQLLLPGPPVVQVTGGGAAVVFFLVGSAAAAKRATALVAVALWCLLGAWMVPSAVPRSVWVFMPWFLVLLTIGIVRTWGVLRATRIPIAIVGFALLVMYSSHAVIGVAGRQFAGTISIQNEHLRRLTTSILTELPRDAVIASDLEAMIHLYTGHTVVPILTTSVENGSADPIGYLCETNVSYIARSGLDHPLAPTDAWIERLGDASTELFQLTNGPSLYRFTCPR